MMSMPLHESPESVGSPHRREPSAQFFRSLVENANDMLVAYDDDGIIVYATPSSERLLGMRPEEGIGENIVGFVHPDDLERTLLLSAQAQHDVSVIGSGLVRLRHADESWVPVEVTLGEAVDSDKHLTVAFCRFALSKQSEAESLLRLLNGADLHDVLYPLLNLIDWPIAGSPLAISWHDAGRRHHVSNQIPEALCGASDDGPWEDVRRSGTRILRNDLGELSDQLQAQAMALDRGGYWIEPVSVVGFSEPALVTFWIGEHDHNPMIHEEGMEIACRYTEIALHFTNQRRALDHAASHDPLTGLVNRTVLVASLDSDDSVGSLVYCDLDGFKPVNDRYGHAMGDKLLEIAAQRLRSCVRSEDLVARIGGDEFVVLARNVDQTKTTELAERILDAFGRPFSFGGQSIEIGVSIGIAHAEHLSVSVLDDADRAMYAAKAAGRGVIRWTSDIGSDERPGS